MTSDNEGSGGDGGGKRAKKSGGYGINIANDMSYKKFLQLKDQLSDSDSGSDSDTTALPLGVEYINPFAGAVNITYDRYNQLMKTDASNIDEEKHMAKFTQADYEADPFEPYDSKESKWKDYYNSNPAEVMDIAKQSSNVDNFMKCVRLSAIYKDFDDRKYQKKEADEDEQKPPPKEDDKKKSADSKILSVIPDNVIYLSFNPKKNYNAAEDLLIGTMIDYMEEYALIRQSGGNKPKSNQSDLVYENGNNGPLYLGGVQYEGGLAVHEGVPYVGGTKVNVLACKIGVELLEKGVEFWGSDGTVYPLVKKIEENIKNDSGSIRQYISKKLTSVFSNKAKTILAVKEYKRKHEERVALEATNIKSFPSLGTMDEDYVPFYEIPPEERKGRDGNVSEEEIKRMDTQFEILKKSQESKKAAAEVTKSRVSRHKPIPKAIVDNCDVFEKLLEIEKLGEGTASKHPSVSFDKLVEELEPYGYSMEQLCSPKSVKEGYESRWKTQWKKMLGQITLSYIRYFCVECYNCPRGVKGVKGVDEVDLWCQLLKLPLDHLIKWFPKWKDLAQIAKDGHGPREVIMEALKCRLVCTCCHYHGHEEHIGDYYERLDTPNHLLYSPDIYGDEHRSVTKVLGIKEVASTKLDLEERGAFSNPREGNGTITYKTVQVVVWMHLRIHLPDLKKGDETAYIERGGKNSLLCTRVFRELIKMLGVKCPGNGESFLNMREPTRSGVELNHKIQREKLMNPGNLFNYAALTRLTHEASVGKLHPISTGSHGKVTAYQDGKIKKPDWYDDDK